ncbi:MAG TPA: hypothetical protein ENK57_09215 [Polyangiaceae bacterium]|nr:hypothetical protein [Polyangiaceae bacterium]
MIAQLSPRQRAARRQWRDPLARARLIAGQLVAAERRRVDRLVEDHLHLLERAAGYWHKRLPAVPYEDLYQVAFLGLRRAAETWDPLHASGVAFSTWAFHGLNGAIRDDLPTLLAGPIRAPKRPAFPRPVVASLDDADHGGAPEPEDESTASNPCEVASRQRTVSVSAPLWATFATSATPGSSPCATGSTVSPH